MASRCAKHGIGKIGVCSFSKSAVAKRREAKLVAEPSRSNDALNGSPQIIQSAAWCYPRQGNSAPAMVVIAPEYDECVFFAENERRLIDFGQSNLRNPPQRLNLLPRQLQLEVSHMTAIPGRSAFASLHSERGQMPHLH